MTPTRAFVIVSFMVVLTVSVAAGWAMHWLDQPLRVSQATVVTVEQGWSVRRVADDLHARGILDRSRLFALYVRLSGRAGDVRAGEYLVRPGITPRSMLELLVSGDVVLHSLTVVEGWTFRQLQGALAAHEVLVQTLDGLSDAEILADIGSDATHPEGLFYPDTYSFPRGETDLQFLERAYRTMQAQLDAIWTERDPDLPIETAYEALVLASIIEKETAVENERREVAGVFIRRLRLGMRLQTDPTVIYGMGEAFDGDIRRRDLTHDTPYNTYTRAGLPPTPIALPGAASLSAAVHPDTGDSIYFVARGDGTHEFSATIEEHNRAVRRFQLGGGDD